MTPSKELKSKAVSIMGINQKDLKLLWGRSGNRCTICRIELSQSNNSATAAFTLGEQAHIVGEEEKAARGKSPLSATERNSYHNLILLCPNHHTEVDKNECDWPVEKLHQCKSEHELWVTETLSETIDNVKLAKQTAIISTIDYCVSLCRLEEWQKWTGNALSTDPVWPIELPDEVYKFRQKVISTIWSEEFDELKRSIITFSILIYNAAQFYCTNCNSEYGEKLLSPNKFYKGWNGFNENYDEDLKKYKAWVKKCHQLIEESTKAANWFCDTVRKYVNPFFFADKGKLLIEGCPKMLFEYRDDEKNNLPNSLSNNPLIHEEYHIE